MRLSFTRSLLLLLLAGLTAVAAPVAAHAATTKKPAASPVVRSAAPTTLKIGQRLTIKGRNFIPGRRKNTVVFKRDGRRAIFVRADRATATEMTVVVPDKLERFLSVQAGAPQVTRFRLRVLSRRFARRFTPLASSPRIGPAAPVAPPAPPAPPDCDGDGTPDATDLDDDNDGLADSAEAGFGTDPCKADTDGDGLRDVWEIESALDLNLKAYFFPGKAPYPNPLFAGDAEQDFDGDGMRSGEEHDMWMRSGGAVPLTYSDGDQDTTTGAAPRTAVGEQGHLDHNKDGWLSDDEKDFDGDRLGNWVEAHGPMVGDWWGSAHTSERPFFGHGRAPTLLDAAAVSAIPGRTPMYADPDVDGDGVPDGADDQDHDGFSNEREITRSVLEIDTDADTVPDAALRMNPYNPCLPDAKSRVCTLHPPFNDAWAPFDGSSGTPFAQGEQRLYLAG